MERGRPGRDRAAAPARPRGSEGSRLRVAILAPGFPPLIGGAENGIMRIAARLGQRHDVTVWTEHAGGALPENGALPFRVRRHPSFVEGEHAGLWGVAGRLPWIRVNLFVARELARFDPDVVLAFYGLPYAPASIWSRVVRRRPVVLSLIGRDVTWKSFRRVDRVVFRAMLRWVDVVVHVSKDARQRLADSVGRPIEGPMIPLPVDPTVATGTPEDRARLRKEWRAEDGDLVLLAIQRLSPVKRFDAMIRAVRLVMNRHSNVILVVGGSGIEHPKLEALAAELGIADRVRFLGWVDRDFHAYYAAADIFVFHSTFETLGLSIVEAMMAGVPVVCADETASGEIVRDTGAGLVAIPLDPADIAEKILRFVGDEVYREKMGALARSAARGLYDWDVVAQQYDQVFATLARRSGR